MPFIERSPSELGRNLAELPIAIEKVLIEISSLPSCDHEDRIV
jgi:hypothetical protein